ncbi:MAG: bifunctional alpha/beta hydrolase/OsmC family protein [Rhodothermales bacterium]
MRYENLTFENRDGQRLSARLDMPIEGAPRAYALFAHCFTCGKSLTAVGHISRALNRRGIAVLRFDFTGLGESEGDFADTTFSSNVEDLVDAAAFLERYDRGPAILVGHSLGGAAVLKAAAQLPSVRAVATIGAPHDPAHVTNLLGDAARRIETDGEADISLGGRSFTIRKSFLDDIEAQRVDDNLKTLGRALLIFHAPLDEIVGIENAALLFQAARHPKSFVSLDQADHLLSDEADSQYVGEVLAAWAGKYLAPAPAPAAGHEGDAHDARVTARVGREGYVTEITAQGHALVADEPVSLGGTDLGPSPYGLLAAALGACTSMTLRMYADRKNWPLEGVVTRLRHEKIHAEDCASCEQKTGKIDRIDREIELLGPLDDTQKTRLLEIADRCPVHRTLHTEVSVITTLAS